MNRILLALVVVLTASVVSVNGQSLFVASESVAYDAANDRYLVSNYGDGNIIEVDHDKNAQYGTPAWCTGSGAKSPVAAFTSQSKATR